MILPLVQLVILGNAFGGKIRGARMGVVDHDHGSEARQVHEAFDAIAANIRTFSTIPYNDEARPAKMCAPASSTARSSFPRSIRGASRRRLSRHRPGGR